MTEKITVTEDQVTLVTGLTNIKLKVHVTYFMCFIVLAITGTFMGLAISNSDWKNTTITGALNAIAIYILKPMTAHFFPPYAGPKSPANKGKAKAS